MKIIYRPEIDGLRAISVLGVILYHLQIIINGKNIFKGGFIGVDIFFVISGYLITSIILKELISTGTFSLLNFYERRIRRILPIFSLVILISLPIAWLILLPNNLIDFSKSILASLLLFSNFFFHYSGQQYDAENGLLTPFLHTWSLSVEEQYYIFFPIILVIIFRYCKKYLIHFLVLNIVVSLGVADWMSRNYPSFSFYFIYTRIWELLAGSLVAFLEIKYGRKNENKLLSNILTFIGLLIIFFYIFFFKTYFPHPSIYTLIVVCASSCLIWFSDKETYVYRLLASKIFVNFGLISYSLYIWHYPILAFFRNTRLYEESLSIKIICLLIIFFISYLSYYFIEKPARNRNNNIKKILTYIIFVYSIAIIFSSLVIKNKGFLNRFPTYLNNSFITSSELLYEEFKIDVKDKNFLFSNDYLKRNIILVGDSHASTLTYDLWKNLDKEKYNLLTSIYGGCQFILNINRVDKNNLKNKYNCNTKKQEERLKFINQKNNSIVILFGRLPVFLEEDKFNNEELGVYEGKWPDFIQNNENSLNSRKARKENIILNYKKTINELIKNQHKIILIYPMPEVGLNVPYILYKNHRFNKFKESFNNNYLSTSYDLYKKRTQDSFKLLDSFKSKNIFRIYPHNLFCNTLQKNRCLTHDNKYIFYADDDHPSLDGAKLINSLIFSILKKIELEAN